jgi:Zn-finger domain-containing protein
VIVHPKNKKRRVVEEDDEDEDDICEEEDEEEDVEVTFGYPVDTAKARKALYRKCLDTVQQSMDKLEDKWTCNNISQVIKFIDSSSSLLNKKELVTPVAFVPSGLSFEENKQIFDKIMQEVMLETPMFCRISSTACPNVKIAFQTICKQLLQKTPNVSIFIIFLISY